MSLDADIWAMDLGLRGRFGMHNSASFDICVVDCSTGNEFFPTMNIPETGFQLFRAEGGSFGIGDEEVTDPASFLDFLASTVTGITAYVRAPNPLGSSILSGTTLSAGGSDEWARLDVDIDSFLRFVRVIPGLPFPPLGACLELEDYGAFDLCYETVDLDSQFRIIQDEAVSFDASVQVRVDFPGSLDYDVVAPDGTTTRSGTNSSVTLPVGHSLRVYTPSSVVPFDLAPTFTLENTIHRDTGLRIKSWLTNRELQLSFDMAPVSNSTSRSVDRGSYEKKSCPAWLDDPVGSTACEAEQLWEGVKRATSSWWEWVSNWVTETVTETANSIDFDVGPLVEENFAETEAAVPLFDRTWSLDGFQDHAGSPFTLDPEDPRIEVTTSVVNSFLSTGMDQGTVTQAIDVVNTGDVPLSAAQILDVIGTSGLSLANLQSFALTANGGFDGSGDQETLAPGQVIPVGGSGTLTLRWAAIPGLHQINVDASGTSPIETLVNDATSVAFGWVPMNIEPKSITRKKPRNNPKGENKEKDDNGKLPVELYDSPGMSVRDIDPSSLALEGVPILKHEIEDDDGQTVLEAKFDRQAVIAGLDARLAGGVAAASTTTAVVLVGTPQIGIPDVTSAEIANALLGGRALATEDAQAMDRAGNGNGRLDLGDLRAAVLAEGMAMAEGRKSDDNFESSQSNDDDGEDEDETDEGGKGTPHTLILTGSLMDGTPIWAEASVLVKDQKGDN